MASGAAIEAQSQLLPETQAQTQEPTQIASQHDDDVELNIWGALIPCNPLNKNVYRIDFGKDKRTYTIGRSSRNDIQFPHCSFVSTKHCTIEWDGIDSAKSAVVLTDTSTNGTFIDGVRIGADGKTKCKILPDGCEIAFGTHVADQPHRASDDYRFFFRLKASSGALSEVDRLYDLQTVLGTGSFGTVMKALNKAEGAWYAVKIIPASKLRKAITHGTLGSMSPENIPKSLKREIDIMQRLKHRHICQFKEVFYDTKEINIVLEWVKGGDLLTFVERSGPISEPIVQYLTYQICDALAYVHNLGIAHRDLKPENILLTDDDPPVVKIADFGLAKVVDTLTVLHTFCGTPAYLAPEVASGGGTGIYDNVVDSWSVGVIVFCMLTQSTPFIEQETTNIVERILTRQVEWGLLQAQEVSELAQDFIRALLETDPKQRLTLKDARDHPWLAAQALHHRSGDPASQPLSEMNVSHQAHIIVTPPTQPQPAVASQSLADASMRSVASDRMVLDTASIVMADANPDDDNTPEREATPPFALVDGSSLAQAGSGTSGSGSGSGSGSSSTIGQPPRLERRADVIRRAHTKGIELLAPSQEMQARALAEEDAERVDIDSDYNGADALAPPVTAALVSSADAVRIPAAADSMLSLRAEPSRGSKRKAVEFSSDHEPSSPPSVRGAEEESSAITAHAARGGGRSSLRGGSMSGPAVSPKRPAAKKPRTQRSAPAPAITTGDGGGEPSTSGMTLTRRRSSRLASPTKPKPHPAHKS